MTRRRSRVAAATATAWLCTACFEPPVDETVTLDFHEDGSVEIGLSVDLAAPVHPGAALEQRLEDERRALLEGRDAWTARFERLDPARERAGWEKEEGRLRHLGRAAAIEDPRLGLRRFFSDTDVALFYSRGERTTELTLEPGIADRADRRQRELVRRELERHAEDVAAHVEAVAALWDYLAERPERARVCLAAVFGELVPEEVRAGLDDPDEDERELVDKVERAMAEVAEILVPAEGEAHSIDEISRLVFDPFPARIRVRVPARIERLEGFEQVGERELLVRPTSLWQAFLALEGRWVAPDPLVALAEASLDAAAFDLDEFAARERSVESVPSADEVKEAVVEELRPAATYRVVWESPAPES